MIHITDHIGNVCQIEKPLQKIVSLVPSITELLYDLGLEDKIVGKTKFCIFPEVHNSKVKIIGGTKNIHVDMIKNLKADLVIANKEENVKEQIEALQLSSKTFTTIVKDVYDALKMIADIGAITDTASSANMICEKIQSVQTEETKPKKVLYLIWKDPYMGVGGDTFIHDMLKRSGFDNVLGQQRRYPEVSMDQINELKPEAILLSSEPYPFKTEHIQEIVSMTGIPCHLIDGSYCSWYGSRMVHGLNYLKSFRQHFEN